MDPNLFQNYLGKMILELNILVMVKLNRGDL